MTLSDILKYKFALTVIHPSFIDNNQCLSISNNKKTVDIFPKVH